MCPLGDVDMSLADVVKLSKAESGKVLRWTTGILTSVMSYRLWSGIPQGVIHKGRPQKVTY